MSHKSQLLTSKLATALLVLVSITLVACGGGGAPGASGNGRVGIVLTDGPTADFDEVNVTITEISLIADDGSENNGHVIIYQGEKTVDLLRLTDFSELFALSDTVPSGKYEKIRLHLKQPNGIELVKKDSMGNVIETFHPNMTGNGKIDLNPRGSFRVLAGQTLYIQMDIDANKSLHIVGTGSGRYQFRPVIFVDVIDDQFSGKLVRHFGYMHNLDTANNQFMLCDQPVMVSDPITATGTPGTSTVALSASSIDGCIKIITDDASTFDPEGNPVDISGIQENAMLTAIGFVRSYEDENTFPDSANHDTATAIQSRDGTNETHEIRLHAEVIELGEKDGYAIVDGTIDSEPMADADAFGLTLADSSHVNVQLQTGTKVFSRSGQRLDYQGIDNGLTASVDGMYSTVDSSILNSALVVVDTAMIDAMEKVNGTVLSVDTANNIITISTDSSEMVIRLADSSTIFLMLGDGASSLSDIIDITAVPLSVELDAYGHAASDGYFDADTVIIEAAATTTL